MWHLQRNWYPELRYLQRNWEASRERMRSERGLGNQPPHSSVATAKGLATDKHVLCSINKQNKKHLFVNWHNDRINPQLPLLLPSSSRWDSVWARASTNEMVSQQLILGIDRLGSLCLYVNVDGSQKKSFWNITHANLGYRSLGMYCWLQKKRNSEGFLWVFFFIQEVSRKQPARSIGEQDIMNISRGRFIW